MASDEFSRLWQDAVSRYHATVGEKKDWTGQRPKTVAELLELVEDEHGKFSVWREKRAKFRKVLQYALAPVEVLGPLLSGAASTVRLSTKPPQVTRCAIRTVGRLSPAPYPQVTA